MEKIRGKNHSSISQEVPQQLPVFVILFPSNETWPLSAYKPPTILVLAKTDTLVYAMKAPWRLLSAPIVALLPTQKKTLQPFARPARTTLDDAAVLSDVLILKINCAFGLSFGSSVNWPSREAVVAKLYTPGNRVRPPRGWPERSTSVGRPTQVA